MNEYLIMLIVVLLFPAMLVIILGFYSLLGYMLCYIIDKFSEKQAPYCDISPLSHSRFRWDADGNGYIDSEIVVKKNDV